jgi:hypothetical protein
MALMMDLMLRCSTRAGTLDRLLSQDGVQTIRRASRKRDAAKRTALLAVIRREADLHSQLKRLEAFIRRYMDALKAYTAGRGRRACIDFGIDATDIGFVRNIGFSPRLLALLGEAGIELDISVYGCSRKHVHEDGCAEGQSRKRRGSGARRAESCPA